MSKRGHRGQEIRDFLLGAIAERRRDVASSATARFGITRQAVSRHLKALVAEQLVTAHGRTSGREYVLTPLERHVVAVELHGLAEDALWRTRIAGLLPGLPRNVADIWHFGFTEMVNNAIDHSEGQHLRVTVETTAATTSMTITDDGVGIFRKIQTELGLEDERHAVLELAKGKLTTDAKRHTGEGIFFASRVFDDYAIVSGGVVFSHDRGRNEDWILERENPERGTLVYMSIGNTSTRTTREIFDKYATGRNDYAFTRTVVPVRLAKQGQEQLVSRSQAKRLLARIERFKVVVLDFDGVDTIGQAFADEVFRVFPSEHPTVKLVPTNATREVKRMIRRAHGAEPR